MSISKIASTDEKVVIRDKGEEKEVTQIRFEQEVPTTKVESFTMLEICRDTYNARTAYLAMRNRLNEAWDTLTLTQKKAWQSEYDEAMKVL